MSARALAAPAEGKAVTAVEGEVRLLTRAEAAAVLKVSTDAVTRRAESGKLLVIRTLGGRRRFFAAEAEALAAGKPAAEARALALAAQARLLGSPP